MSKPEPEYWLIVLKLDHPARLYAVQRIVKANGAGTPAYYVQVEAYDEIGAYNEAQKVLTRLGFRAGDV